MRCAWQAYLKILPIWMRDQVDELGRDRLQELRLRIERPPELVRNGDNVFLQRNITAEDLTFCVNAASNYSPWAASTLASGYITAPGGHRIGICGDVVMHSGTIQTIKNISSLCVRVARDFPGIATQALHLNGSILIIGSPGTGKTTFLRDLIRQKSNSAYSAVAVVDERGEVFPSVESRFYFSPGLRTEVLFGCDKSSGIEILLRTMNPNWIAVDEITALVDTKAIFRAGGCGVDIMATAHAADIEDLNIRSVYKPFVGSGFFRNIIVMNKDKSWKIERVNV